MSGVVTTYQLRLPRSPHETMLSEMASHLGYVERHLHKALEVAHEAADAEIEGYGGSAAFKRLRDPEGNRLQHPLMRLKNDIKVRFLREFGITGRQYNSILRGLEGRHDSLRELLSAEIKKTERNLSRLEKKIQARGLKITSFSKIAAAVDARAKQGKGPTKAQKKRLMSRPEYVKARFHQHHQKRKAQSLRDKLVHLKAEASRNLPSVIFGSKSLLRKRSTIHSNDLEAIERWRGAWNTARSGGFMLMGSKDETAGCQSCIGQIAADGRLSLTLRLPNALVVGSEKYLTLEALDLPDFGGNVIRAALKAHVEKSNNRAAITYRFVRDQNWPESRKMSAWRVCLTITEPVPEIGDRSFETYVSPRGHETTSAVGTTPSFRGAIGVDINADHLAWAVIDRFGNPIKDQCGKISLPLRGKSSGHRADIIGDAARDIVDIALRTDLPIVLENLDFKVKKQEMSDQGTKYARMLSSFAHAKIQNTIRRRASRAGVELVDVNPAYTSTIGRVNYAKRYGLSVHLSAAVSIARRAARFSERVNYIHGFRGRRNTLNAGSDNLNEQRRHVWRQWGKVRKTLTSYARPGSWPAASNATSSAPRAAAYTKVPGADVMAALEEDRLALERLMSCGMGENDRAAAPRRHDEKCSIMINIDHV